MRWKAIAEKADEAFFLKCQFQADPPKDSGTYFSKNIFAL
jgi:hypothetical protein